MAVPSPDLVRELHCVRALAAHISFTTIHHVCQSLHPPGCRVRESFFFTVVVAVFTQFTILRHSTTKPATWYVRSKIRRTRRKKILTRAR